jgi:hypothetical protein
MASIQKKGDSWYCQFLYKGKRHTFTIGRVLEDEAEAKANQVDYLLMRLNQNFLQLPPEMDIVSFLLFDGKPPVEKSEGDSITLKTLKERYLNTHDSSLEPSTLSGIKTHFKHLSKTLGERFPIQEISLADLQRHVDERRKKKKGTKENLSPATIRKEIVTLRTAWN